MITQIAGPVLVRPQRSLGGLFPDVVVEESHEDSLEVTQHPVELGADIADHAYMNAATLTIRAAVSDSSAAPAADGSPHYSQDFYVLLRALQKSREPFDIVTGRRQYSNMLLTRLSVLGDAASDNALNFTAECREVLIVRTHVVSVPAAKRHKNPGATGASVDKGQQQAQQTESKSILKWLLGDW